MKRGKMEITQIIKKSITCINYKIIFQNDKKNGNLCKTSLRANQSINQIFKKEYTGCNKKINLVLP